MRNGFLVNGEPAIDVSKITPIKSLEPKDDHTIDSEHLVNSEIRYDKYIVDKREKQLIFAGTLVVGTSLSVLLYHNIFFSLVLLFFYIKIANFVLYLFCFLYCEFYAVFVVIIL